MSIDTQTSTPDDIVQNGGTFTTQIDTLPDGTLHLKKPIVVECTLGEECVQATALQLGLIGSGIGMSVQEALNDLTTEIQRQYLYLTKPKVEAVGYAGIFRDQLKEIIELTADRK